MQTTQKRILIVEDEALIAADLQQRLTELGYLTAAIAASAAEAIREIEAHRPDLLLLDIRIQGRTDGVALAHQVKARYELPVIFLTAHADRATVGRAKVTGPFGYLVKPVGTSSLQTAIELALYKHEVEQELRRQRAWLETTLRSIGEGILVTNSDVGVAYVNDSALALLRATREACLGQPLSAVFPLRFNDSGLPVDDLTKLAALEERPLALPEDVHVRDPEGAKIPLEGTIAICQADGKRYGWVLAFRDIASRQNAEREMREEQKMIAVGRLAAGVSDDLEGMLGAVAECTLAAEQARESDVLTGLRNLGDTAAGLHGRLRSLIRQKGLRLERLSVTPFLETQLTELRRTLPPNLVLTAALSDNGAAVHAGFDQFAAMVAEMVNNAAAQMPDGGEIVLETSSGGSNPADTVRIAVHDRGSSGHDDGSLGLTAARSAATTLGGFVTVTSQPGAGNTIEAFLPDAGGGLPDPRAQWPTVLLVEENASVRRVLHNHLEANDYNLLEAETAADALDTAEVFDGAIDLLVVDISHMALALQLRQMRPDMRVLVAAETDAALVELPYAAAIRRPIQKTELLDKMATLLG